MTLEEFDGLRPGDVVRAPSGKTYMVFHRGVNRVVVKMPTGPRRYLRIDQRAEWDVVPRTST